MIGTQAKNNLGLRSTNPI